MPPPHPGAVAFRVLQEDFVSNDNDGHHEQPVEQPSPDLTYLHPDNLHIGHIGVFAGDWAWTGNPPRIPVGFIGVLIDYFFRTTKIIYVKRCRTQDGHLPMSANPDRHARCRERSKGRGSRVGWRCRGSVT
jgi:hypothetical protein